MPLNEKLNSLMSLQRQVDLLRKELGIAAPDKVLFLAEVDGTPDQVVVEADGFGGATTNVVEGNYPVDYVVKFERSFPTEGEAEAAAEHIAFEAAAPARMLTSV